MLRSVISHVDRNVACPYNQASMAVTSESVDVVVLGAGAAGLMAAMEAGRRGRRVVLLDSGPRAGRKILISGGGRCNFTNMGTRPENFLSENPHFARSALARYTPAEFVALVERHGIAYHEKTLGQLFCDGSASQIVTMLEREGGAAGVRIRCGVRIVGVRRGEAAASTRFTVETDAATLHCISLVVATGGLSIPKLGATAFGYELAEQMGHALVPPRPALVPLVLSVEERERWCDLAGVSTEAVAAAGQPAGSRVKARRGSVPAFREKLLITHRGLSGPAVLQISSYWTPGGPVQFDLAPGRKVFGGLRDGSLRRDAAGLVAALRGGLPSRFAERWAATMTEGRPDWTNAGLQRMEDALHAWTVQPDGTEGYAKAEVTAGGVDTRELDSSTMESRRVPGLYFVGEVVDVTGWLGGYNFQWAWASGAAAGRVA